MLFDYLPIDYQLKMIGWLFAGVVSLYFLLTRRTLWKASPGKTRCVHLLLSVWMFLAALTVVELYFSVIFDSTDSFNMTLVSQKWFNKYVKPDQKYLEFQNGRSTTYRNDTEYPKTISDGREHICFIGDSFTFGHGIENVADRFSNRVSSSLERDHPGQFVVSNLADAGRDAHWVRVVVQTLFESEFPVDTVVYAVCLNDIETFHKRHQTYYVKLGSHHPKFFSLPTVLLPELRVFPTQDVHRSRHQQVLFICKGIL